MTHKLSRIVDVAKVQALTDLLHEATGISISVTGPDGVIVADSGWQEICRRFHQVSPKTKQFCRRSEASIAFEPIAGQEYIIEKCKNGLIDVRTPMMVLGRHVADLVAGQFLLSPPDMKFFKRQALRSGFDESAYMNALSKVPVIDGATLRAFLQSFSVLTEILAEAGVRKLVDEMSRHKQAGVSLDAQSRTPEEVYTTLQVLLNQKEEGKSGLEENILSNVKELILPYVEKLKRELPAEQTGTVDIIETNLREITSPIVRKMQTWAFPPGKLWSRLF